MAIVLHNLEAALLVHCLPMVFGIKKRQKDFAHGRLGLRLLSSVPSGQGGTLAQAPVIVIWFPWSTKVCLSIVAPKFSGFRLSNELFFSRDFGGHSFEVG